jgi:deoxycytidylate deaminase
MLQAGSGKLAGATIYVTRVPCISCEKIIHTSGIERIIYRNPENGKVHVRFA